MEPIIKSILDTDLYKISMMNFVLELFPDTKVEYRFKNRGKQRFNNKFLNALQEQINYLGDLFLTEYEYNWMKETFPYLTVGYIEYLKNFRFNPSNVFIKLTQDNNLELTIKGKWLETILYEVPLMAIISELYFTLIDTNWNYTGQSKKAIEKIKILSENNCKFIDFGTRRRRSFETQELIINNFLQYTKENKNSTFLGTSNIFFAFRYNIKCFGSIAHEVIQASQVLNSYNHCNYYALENWVKVFKNVELGTALTDTVGTDAFFRDFNRKMSMLYPSLRHDSGNAFDFVDKVLYHYKKMKINPLEKTIIFSDGLDVPKCLEIKKYCENKIQCSFGIGTSFTNNGFGENSKPLNMVIKLYNVNGQPTVKLSDNEGKENGDPKAVEFMKWIVKNQR